MPKPAPDGGYFGPVNFINKPARPRVQLCVRQSVKETEEVRLLLKGRNVVWFLRSKLGRAERTHGVEVLVSSGVRGWSVCTSVTHIHTNTDLCRQPADVITLNPNTLNIRVLS